MNMTIYGYMFDSASGIFPDNRLRALYYNGLYAHQPYEVKRGQVWIDVLANAAAHCSILDVENGDARPQDVPGWLDERNPVGRGVIYCSRSKLGPVIDFAGERPFDLWLATLDATLPPITVPHGQLLAIQAWKSLDYDMSAVVNKAWWDTHALDRTFT